MPSSQKKKQKTQSAEPESGGGPSSGVPTLVGELLAQCKAAVRELSKHNDAAAFLEPVDWKALGLIDYPTLIKKPMDLGTIMKGLDAGQYASFFEVAADIDLVWSNAMAYNLEDSFIYNLAAGLKTFSDRKMAPVVAAAREAGEVPHELTFEMKKRFNDNAAQLSPKDLYGILGVIESSCKHAVKKSRNGDDLPEVEFDIDALDVQTFLKVEKYVQDCLAGKKPKKK